MVKLTFPNALLLLVTLALTARLFLYGFTGYTSDDAFITYRYAANIAEGKGFVYNPGERVQGTSSPVYTLVLAAVAWISKPEFLPGVSRAIGILLDLFSVILLWHIASSLGEFARFLVCTLYALFPKAVLIGVSGMEAPMVVLGMLVSYHLISTERLTAAAVVLGIVLLVRIDAIVWVSLCLIMALMFTRTRAWSGVLLMFLPAGVWLMFSQWYFGSAFPHSVIAKSVSWSHLFPVFDPLRVMGRYFPFEGLEGASTTIKGALVVLLCVPVVVEFVRLSIKRHWMVTFPTFFLLYNLAFSFGRVVMADWYYLPGYMAYFVTLGSFAQGLTGTIATWEERNSPSAIARAVIIGCLLVLLVIGAFRWRDNPAGLFHRQNRALGVWLRENAAPDARVLLEPIGYVGWESQLYIDDYIGLVSPLVVAYRKRYARSDAWFIAYLTDLRPDYIVLRNWEIPQNALFHGYGDGIFHSETERSWYHENYEQVRWEDTLVARDSVYLVLYKRSSTIPHLAQHAQ